MRVALTHEQRALVLEKGVEEGLACARKLVAVLEVAAQNTNRDSIDDHLDSADGLVHELQRLSNRSWEA